MALVHFDRVHETSTTTGTGSLTLAGAVDAGWRTFDSVCSTNDTFYYTIVHPGVAWETGLGTYSGTNTLARTSVKAGSNGTSAVNLGAGTKFVFMTPIAFMMSPDMVGFQPLDASLTAYAALTTAANKGLYFTGADTPATFDISAGGIALANVTGTADRVPWFSASNTAALITVTTSGRAIMGIAGTSGSAPYLSSTDTWSLTATSAGGRALWNVTGTADRVPWFSASNTVGLITVTASGRALMGVAGTSGSFPYLSGTDTWSLSTITTAGRNLLDDADAAAQRTTLGIAGKQAIWIPASAMVSRTTNGAAAGTAEMSTNKNMFATLDFDTTTQEFAQFAWCMPSSWDEGTVTFVPVWSHPSTSTNFGVVFQLAGVAISNDDAGDVAFGTAQTSTDTGGTTNDIYKGPESSAITIAGSPAAGDYVMFQVARVPANGSDTMAVDARLHGIVLFITTNDTVDS